MKEAMHKLENEEDEGPELQDMEEGPHPREQVGLNSSDPNTSGEQEVVLGIPVSMGLEMQETQLEVRLLVQQIQSRFKCFRCWQAGLFFWFVLSFMLSFYIFIVVHTSLGFLSQSSSQEEIKDIRGLMIMILPYYFVACLLLGRATLNICRMTQITFDSWSHQMKLTKHVSFGVGGMKFLEVVLLVWYNQQNIGESFGMVILWGLLAGAHLLGSSILEKTAKIERRTRIPSQ